MPCRPPIVLTSSTSASGSRRAPVDGDGPALHERDRDVLGLDGDRGVPELHAHDRLDDLHRLVEVLERLGLVGGAPDVGVGGVGLLLARPVGQVALGEPGAHLVAATELGDEVGIQPRLVDAQVGVGEQAVAVEPLDVVALEGRAVAPDLDLVGVHGTHEQRAGDRPAQGSGVEVGLAAGADVERPARDGRQALLDERAAAVDQPGQLGAVLAGAVGDGVDLGLVVLTEVGRVRAGDRPLLAHPRDGHGGVETPGEGDADALADGQGGEDLGHDARLYRTLHMHKWSRSGQGRWKVMSVDLAEGQRHQGGAGLGERAVVPDPRAATRSCRRRGRRRSGSCPAGRGDPVNVQPLPS